MFGSGHANCGPRTLNATKSVDSVRTDYANREQTKDTSLAILAGFRELIN